MNRVCGGGSWIEMPTESGSGSLKEIKAVNAGGSRELSEVVEGVKWSGTEEEVGWNAVMERVENVREEVRGVAE